MNQSIEGVQEGLFDRLPLGLYLTAANGQIIDANSAFSNLLGISSPEMLLGHNIQEFLVDQKKILSWGAMNELGGEIRHRVYLRARGGKRVSVLERLVPLREQEGFQGYMGLIVDSELYQEAKPELALTKLSGVPPEQDDLLEFAFQDLCEVVGIEEAALVLADSESSLPYIEVACGSWRDYSGELLSSAEKVTEETGLCLQLTHEQQLLGALLVKDGLLGEEVKVRHLYQMSEVLLALVDWTDRDVYVDHLEQEFNHGVTFTDHLLNNIPVSLVVLDRRLRIVALNSNFASKMAKAKGDMLHKEIDEVFPPALLQYTHLDNRVREAFHKGNPVNGGKLTYRAPGLTSRVYYYRLVPLKIKGEVQRVVLLMDDITDQERLGEEVRQMERHLASLVECASDMVISMDLTGRITTWNTASEEITGYRSGQVLGKALTSLCSVEHRPQLERMLSALAEGDKVPNVEIDLQCGDDRDPVPISWSAAPIQDGEGSVTSIVAVGRDLTERKRLEAELIRSAKMASLGVMAGGIAHELRNPLSIVLAAAQLIQQYDDPEIHNQGLEKICRATKRASSTVEALLKFARGGGGQMARVDVEETLDDTLSLVNNEIRLHKVVVQRDFESGIPCIKGNAALLQQVFTNLILNACKAMPKGGKLTLATRLFKDNQVEVSFKDTGRGIPEENLLRIFDPFFTTMPVGEGTGLGLAIAYTIIEQHQGHIDVDSEEGEGTNFRVRLPVESSN